MVEFDAPHVARSRCSLLMVLFRSCAELVRQAVQTVDMLAKGQGSQVKGILPQEIDQLLQVRRTRGLGLGWVFRRRRGKGGHGQGRGRSGGHWKG